MIGRAMEGTVRTPWGLVPSALLHGSFLGAALLFWAASPEALPPTRVLASVPIFVPVAPVEPLPPPRHGGGGGGIPRARPALQRAESNRPDERSSLALPNENAPPSESSEAPEPGGGGSCVGCIAQPNGDPAVDGPGPGPGPRVVRVHEGVREPRKLHDVKPLYPEAARIAHLEGLVILECTVGTNGRVADLRVLRGAPFFTEAATDAVKQWVYAPTLLDGVPVAVVMTVTVNFTLAR